MERVAEEEVIDCDDEPSEATGSMRDHFDHFRATAGGALREMGVPQHTVRSVGML